MRGLIILLCLVVIFYALRTLIRSAVRGYRAEGERSRLKGEEMVRDPQCQTYVVKERAVSRRILGTTHFFCSDACARQYEERHRS
jgi:YHS domain-containing protein